jgi:hypothetical protein
MLLSCYQTNCLCWNRFYSLSVCPLFVHSISAALSVTRRVRRYCPTDCRHHWPTRALHWTRLLQTVRQIFTGLNRLKFAFFVLIVV